MTGSPAGAGPVPRGLPRGQSPPVEDHAAQRVDAKQCQPGEPRHHEPRDQRVDDYDGLVRWRAGRLTRAIQPYRYPGAIDRAGDVWRGRGGQLAGLLAAPRQQPTCLGLPDAAQAVGGRAVLKQHSRSRAQAYRSRVLHLIGVGAGHARDDHGQTKGGGQRDQDRALDPVDGPPERVPPGQEAGQPGHSASRPAGFGLHCPPAFTRRTLR
jgi:hypothetical protein